MRVAERRDATLRWQDHRAKGIELTIVHVGNMCEQMSCHMARSVVKVHEWSFRSRLRCAAVHVGLITSLLHRLAIPGDNYS